MAKKGFLSGVVKTIGSLTSNKEIKKARSLSKDLKKMKPSIKKTIKESSKAINDFKNPKVVYPSGFKR